MVKKIADKFTCSNLRCVLQLAVLASWIAGVVVLSGVSNASSAALDTVVHSPALRACCPADRDFNIDLCVLFAELTHTDCGPAFETYYAAQHLQWVQAFSVLLAGIVGGFAMLLVVLLLGAIFRTSE